MYDFALQNKSAEIDLQLHELDIQVKKLLIEKEEAATAQAKAALTNSCYATCAFLNSASTSSTAA